MSYRTGEQQNFPTKNTEPSTKDELAELTLLLDVSKQLIDIEVLGLNAGYLGRGVPT